MATPNLDLPPLLREEAERWASQQGVSLDQFVVWAVAEKVGGLKQAIDDRRFRHVTYRRGASGWPTPVIRGSGIRVQTIVLASRSWNLSSSEIAEEYDLAEDQIADALAFYEAHRGEIDAAIADERQLEPAHA